MELKSLLNHKSAMAIKFLAYSKQLQLSSSNFGWQQLKKSSYDS
jgi:hypothetical protein